MPKDSITLHYSDLHPRWEYPDYLAAGQLLAAVGLVLALVISVPVMMVMGG